jgi:N-acetylneuraminate synthase
MEFSINKRIIGENCDPYIIAEISANHNGDIGIAKASIISAKNHGADAVKLQTYTPDTMTIDCNKDDFLIKDGLWKGNNLYGLYQQAYTPFEWHEDLFTLAKDIGITCFSSPFDESAVDLLESVNVPAYKIASFEVTDLTLLKSIAATKKPVIMSTGMANLEEIDEAVNTLYENGTSQLAILHCVSGYPTTPEYANLKTITDLKNRYKCEVGLSDHTLTHSTAITSIALGASIIEKHFIIDPSIGGPDSSFSITPEQLRELKTLTSEASSSIGKVNYELKGDEKNMIKFRRSLYAVKDIKSGEVFTKDNMRRIRPGFGIEPKHYESVIGKTAKCDISFGTALKWDLIDK